MALHAGKEQRRVAVLLCLVDVGARGQQQGDHLEAALHAGEEQRCAAIQPCLVDVSAGGEQQGYH
eukprot:1491824-Prymnesium_polylepis.1